MLKWYSGKERDYITEEINGSNKLLLPGQSKANLRMPRLYHFSWKYIKSETLKELEKNRATLIALLRPKDRHYIDEHWRAHKREVVYYYTKSYPNLGSIASQRGESYHPIVREITNKQLSFKNAGRALFKKILSIYKELDTSEYTSARGYSRLGQLYRDVFIHLRCTISRFEIEIIEVEWKRMNEMMVENRGTYL
jgi:hypothetical protein